MRLLGRYTKNVRQTQNPGSCNTSRGRQRQINSCKDRRQNKTAIQAKHETTEVQTSLRAFDTKAAMIHDTDMAKGTTPKCLREKQQKIDHLAMITEDKMFKTQTLKLKVNRRDHNH